MATTLLRTRIDSKRIREARKILDGIGVKPADAVNMFFAQVVAHRGIPFAVQEEGYAYAAREYGVTPAELDAKVTALDRDYRREKKAGTVRRFHGLADLRE
jgi:addiction module RelB/DinJ family antitoxin